MIIRRVSFKNSEYQLVKTRCSKANCGKCPHGPYWYWVSKLRDGRTVRRYIGKTPTADLAEILDREDRT